MSGLDTKQQHARIVIARSMVGVERGTGIPGLDELRPEFEKHGFELRGFEMVDPSEQRGPSELRPTLEKLRALRDAVDSEIREIECYGDPQPGTADDEDDDFLDDLASGAHYRIEDAWRAYDSHYEGRERP